MNHNELCEEINALLSGLRKCDKQADAISWMARAYTAMERSLEYLNEPEQTRFVFVPQKIEVFQSIPAPQVLKQESAIILPLKPLPKAWTRKDTESIERAARARINQNKLQKWAERKCR